MYLLFPRHSRVRLFSWIAISVFLGGWSSVVHALDKVTLQLKWTHAFQFAGYYAAQEKGFYRDAGLDVSFVEAHPGDNPVKAVLDGKAQYGVGSSSLLLARKAGQPVVVLAAIFQHSPLVLIAAQHTPSQNIHDLLGKRIMLESQDDELLAYLKQEGIPPERITRVEHSFNTQDLIDGKVDAISGYTTNQPYYLDRVGFHYHIYTPRSVGIDFYGDNLFTTEHELKSHPARVESFREASLRGWNYAMEHPDEIVDLILSKYPDSHPRDYYLFESRQLVPMLRTELIEIGYMSPGRWRHIADTYAELGLLPNDFSLDGFLYQPGAAPDLRWLVLALTLLVMVSAIAFYIYRNNRRLSAALDASNTTRELLRVSEERHRLLADNATDVIWMMDLDGRLTYVSPSVEKLRGYTSSEVMLQSLDDVFTAASLPVAKAAFDQAKGVISSGGVFPEFRGELEQPCKDGSTVWTDVTLSAMQNMEGQLIAILGVSRDITERKKLEGQIRQLAFHDPLTGLPNRRLLSDRMSQLIAANKRSGCSGALLFLDLDNFKPLNDRYGHDVGDLLLIEVAGRLKDCVRESDTISRFGGDEFVVMLGELSSERALATLQAATIAEKILKSLAQPYWLLVKPDGLGDEMRVEHRCAASIGVALFSHDEDDPDEVLKKADGAMYAAKASGRNTVRFAPDLLQRTDPARRTEADFTPLLWSADYESGNALIDTQHRALFDEINNLLAAILAACPNEEVCGLIDRLRQEAKQHFADEEAIIAAAGFPGSASHSAQHRAFLEQTSEVVGRFKEGDLPLGELFRFLIKDVFEHITVEDPAFFPYLKKVP